MIIFCITWSFRIKVFFALPHANRRVARIWKRRGGGCFERMRKVQTTLTRIFIVLHQFHTVCPKIETKFVGKLRNSKFFSPKIRWSPNKNKKRSSPKLGLIFRPKSEIQTFFPPKIRWSPKIKKKVFTEIGTDFSAKSGNSNV